MRAEQNNEKKERKSRSSTHADIHGLKSSSGLDLDDNGKGDIMFKIYFTNFYFITGASNICTYI